MSNHLSIWTSVRTSIRQVPSFSRSSFSQSSFSRQQFSSAQVPRRCVFGLGLALSVLMLSGCTTVAETASDSPTQQIEMPAVRLPSIRLSNRSPEEIASLVAEREEETVAVSGTIAQRAAILEGWLYEVQDETGSIWVLTDRSEPEVGEIAIVEGVLYYEPIVVGEIDAGDVYLEEKSYRVVDEEG